MRMIGSRGREAVGGGVWTKIRAGMGVGLSGLGFSDLLRAAGWGWLLDDGTKDG
jgi:hypothetical protein